MARRSVEGIQRVSQEKGLNLAVRKMTPCRAIPQHPTQRGLDPMVDLGRKNGGCRPQLLLKEPYVSQEQDFRRGLFEAAVGKNR